MKISFLAPKEKISPLKAGGSRFDLTKIPRLNRLSEDGTLFVNQLKAAAKILSERTMKGKKTRAAQAVTECPPDLVFRLNPDQMKEIACCVNTTPNMKRKDVNVFLKQIQEERIPARKIRTAFADLQINLKKEEIKNRKEPFLTNCNSESVFIQEAGAVGKGPFLRKPPADKLPFGRCSAQSNELPDPSQFRVLPPLSDEDSLQISGDRSASF